MPLAVFVSNNVFLSGREDPEPATIEVDPLVGRITAVHEHRRPRDKYPDLLDEDWHDCGDKWLLPGLVECVCLKFAASVVLILHMVTSSHVHLNEPGRTHWEGFSAGTQAAVSGGVTAVIDMPLNSIPPTTTVANLEVKRAAARGADLYTDVGFWGGVIPGNDVRLDF